MRSRPNYKLMAWGWAICAAWMFIIYLREKQKNRLQASNTFNPNL